MTSSVEAREDRDFRRTRFIGRVRRELKRVLQEAAEKGMTQKDIAQKLGISPSVITRRLNGSANLTLASIGDLAWALDKYPRLALLTAEQLEADRGSNSVAMYVVPHHASHSQIPNGQKPEGTAKSGAASVVTMVVED